MAAKCQASGRTANGVAVLGGMRVPLLFRFGGSLKQKRETTGAQPGPSRRRVGLNYCGASCGKKEPLPLARRRKKESLPLARRGQHEAVKTPTGVKRTATEVIAPAGAGLSGKRARIATRSSRTRGGPDRSFTKFRSKSVVCPRLFSGDVSDAQHLADHVGCKSFCLRCDYHRRRKTYEALSRLPNGTSWLAGGVRRGLWGLGCRVCAKYVASGRKCFAGRFSKFANFQVRPKTGYHARFQIEQHQRSAAHRQAAGAKRARGNREDPEPQPLPLACPAAPSSRTEEVLQGDAALLRGNVPSAAEWRDAWALLSETTSLRKCARVQRKQFSTDDPGEMRTRKRRRKQLCVMAEVLRVRTREILRNATSISVSLDESKYQVIVRYRCDVPSPAGEERGMAGGVGASGFCHAGVLGVLDCKKGSVAEFEEDHAVTAVKQLDSFLTKFCTPLGRGRRKALPLACDESLKSHIMRTVTSLSADGAAKERRALFLAGRELFPNLLIVIRDPAHAIRIASKALHCDDVFGEVWHELFDARHALAPDLMNSAKWHNLFVAIQEEGPLPLAEPGIGRMPLRAVVQNLSFAKQRFDSTAGPVGKIALMLLPVATLLAYISSDNRHEKAMRERASALLRKLDTKFCMAVGVSADWGIICNWFLRLFDVASHDIALSRSQIDCMVETLDAVFLEGRVFKKIMQAASGAAAAAAASSDEPLPRVGTGGEAVGFVTGTVMASLRRKYVFFAGGDPVLHWGEPRDAHKEELLDRVQNAACLTKERLLADFPKHDLRSALAMFDRRLLRKGFKDLPCLATHRFLLRGVRQVAKALGCDETAAALQYHDVALYMLSQSAPGMPLAANTNQEAWARLLDDSFWHAACPRRLVGSSHVLRTLVRFYISIEDGECSVERDFAFLRYEQGEHRTSNHQFLDDCLIAKLLGPLSVAEFEGGSSSTGREQLTPFSRECACLWRRLYGARAGHYNPAATRAAAAKATASRGPLRRASVGVLAAARLAVQCKRARAASAAVHPGAGTDRSARWNEKMQKFHKRSLRNIPGVTQVRAAPGGAFLKPPGVYLGKRRAAGAPPAGPCPHRMVAVLTASGVEGILRGKGCRVLTGRHRCADANLVVVPDLAILHDAGALAADVDVAVSYLYVVALGVDVVTETQLAAVGYVPGRLSSTQYLRHARACETTSATLTVADRLDVECPAVRAALRRIARARESNIRVEARGAPASGGVSWQTLRDAVGWAVSVRRVVNELGPKVLTADGARLKNQHRRHHRRTLSPPSRRLRSSSLPRPIASSWKNDNGKQL